MLFIFLFLRFFISVRNSSGNQKYAFHSIFEFSQQEQKTKLIIFFTEQFFFVFYLYYF